MRLVRLSHHLSGILIWVAISQVSALSLAHLPSHPWVSLGHSPALIQLPALSQEHSPPRTRRRGCISTALQAHHHGHGHAGAEERNKSGKQAGAKSHGKASPGGGKSGVAGEGQEPGKPGASRHSDKKKGPFFKQKPKPRAGAVPQAAQHLHKDNGPGHGPKAGGAGQRRGKQKPGTRSTPLAEEKGNSSGSPQEKRKGKKGADRGIRSDGSAAAGGKGVTVKAKGNAKGKGRGKGRASNGGADKGKVPAGSSSQPRFRTRSFSQRGRDVENSFERVIRALSQPMKADGRKAGNNSNSNSNSSSVRTVDKAAKAAMKPNNRGKPAATKGGSEKVSVQQSPQSAKGVRSVSAGRAGGTGRSNSNGGPNSGPTKRSPRASRPLAGVDPPQRYVEVIYNRQSKDIFAWITTNSGSFGPMLSHEHAHRLNNKVRIGYLQHWVRKAQAYNVAPPELDRLAGGSKGQPKPGSGSGSGSFTSSGTPPSGDVVRDTARAVLNAKQDEEKEEVVQGKLEELVAGTAELDTISSGESEAADARDVSGLGEEVYKGGLDEDEEGGEEEGEDEGQGGDEIAPVRPGEPPRPKPIPVSRPTADVGDAGEKLLQAANERFKTKYPRVIAIGDVHGCIDELQELIRLVDYSPGDLLLFLGDLVAKGPDSVGVIQMARELGAIGVRGNHEYEVLRWHHIITSGEEIPPSAAASEHYEIAKRLSPEDIAWLKSCPWYLHSRDLDALFVHAGFVSGIRLPRQNPRLMMNMRSILPDGTVTSKHFEHWPWARLWDGPLSVYFGHDAERGLQMHEHAVGIDTGCVYGGRLTACILPERRLVSVDAKYEYIKFKRRKR
ncbi:unnamed protein product [Chrysoparadoxa australica]